MQDCAFDVEAEDNAQFHRYPVQSFEDSQEFRESKAKQEKQYQALSFGKAQNFEPAMWQSPERIFADGMQKAERCDELTKIRSHRDVILQYESLINMATGKSVPLGHFSLNTDTLAELQLPTESNFISNFGIESFWEAEASHTPESQTQYSFEPQFQELFQGSTTFNAQDDDNIDDNFGNIRYSLDNGTMIWQNTGEEFNLSGGPALEEKMFEEFQVNNIIVVLGDFYFRSC